MIRAFLVLLLVGCVEIPTGVQDLLDDLATTGEIASLTCPDSLSIVNSETGSCSGANIDGTLIDIDGYAPLIWKSSDPSAVTVTITGTVEAGTVADSALITGIGTNDSFATAWIVSY